MALLCLQYNERPQIGQILQIDRNVATIKWFDGTWNSKWKVYTYKVGKKTVAWEEEVQVKILTNDVFTDGMRLSMSCKHKLQNLYDSA